MSSTPQYKDNPVLVTSERGPAGITVSITADQSTWDKWVIMLSKSFKDCPTVKKIKNKTKKR